MVGPLPIDLPNKIMSFSCSFFPTTCVATFKAALNTPSSFVSPRSIWWVQSRFAIAILLSFDQECFSRLCPRIYCLVSRGRYRYDLQRRVLMSLLSESPSLFAWASTLSRLDWLRSANWPGYVRSPLVTTVSVQNCRQLCSAAGYYRTSSFCASQASATPHSPQKCSWVACLFTLSAPLS